MRDESSMMQKKEENLTEAQNNTDKIEKLSELKKIIKETDLLTDEGKHEEAIGLLTSYMEKNPPHLNLFMNRGYCLFQLGRHADAILDFDKAIKLKANAPHVLYFRARSKEFLDDYDGALEDFLESARLKPNEQDVYIRIAAMYEKLDQLDQAIGSYQKALEFGATAEIYISLGMIHQFKKQVGEAEDCYTKALELDADNSIAKRRLKGVR